MAAQVWVYVPRWTCYSVTTSVNSLQNPRRSGKKDQRLWRTWVGESVCHEKTFFWTAFLLVAVDILFCPASGFAAPGGQIVSGLFKTPLGKLACLNQ